MRKEILAEGVELYLGDCREILPTLGGIDAVVTSPPYAQQRDYGKKISNWRALVGCLAAVNDGGATQILVNLGLVHKDGAVSPYWQGLVDDMQSAGWRHFGWYVWDKLYGRPGDSNGRLAPAHEFIFHFNRNAINPNKWVKTQGRNGAGTGLRDPDGSLRINKSQHTVGQPYKIPDSVIRLPPHQLRGGPENEHPAIFPVELPEHLIRTFTAIGQCVCDPFVGSGTSGVASVKLGRKFIGIEIDPKYFDMARKRIQAALDAPDMFVEAPKPAKQEAFEL